MNNNDDNHLRADSVNDSHPYSDKERPTLPKEELLPADGKRSEDDALSTDESEAAKNPTDRLKCLEPNMQPRPEAVENSREAAQLDEPVWTPQHESRADRVTALVTALASKQLELERYEQENVELNSQISSQTARLRALKARLQGHGAGPSRSKPDAFGDAELARANAETRELKTLAPRLEDRGAGENSDGGEDYVQALHAQTGRLDGMLDTLAQTHTWVAELDSALDEDLNACNELVSKMQAHEEQLAELETLVGQVCDADQTGNETPENSVEAKPTEVDDLDTLTDVHAVNRLLVAMNGDHVIKYPLYKSIVTIGRGPLNDIQIRTQYVSRSHARIVTSNSDAIIEDMDSKNGITVNGRSVQLRRLKNGDVVDVGKIHFKFIDLMAEDAGEGNA